MEEVEVGWLSASCIFWDVSTNKPILKGNFIGLFTFQKKR